MPPNNTFITPSIVARLAYNHLYETPIMAGLVHRDYEADFNGAVGDTITVRKPAEFEAKEWDANSGIDVQDATESSFTVSLDTILDVSFAVPSKERTLDIRSVNEQLVVPAVEALVQGVERKILTLRDDIVREVGSEDGLYGQAGADYDDPRVLIDANRALNEMNVPRAMRYAVVGPGIEAGWLGDDLFHRADHRGDTAGLREASIGRKFGFDNFSSTYIEPADSAPDPGDPTTEVGIAFHRTALALVMRTLALPEGASAAAFGDRGVGIRVVRDYDIDKKQDVMSLDVLLGVKTLDPNRAVLIKGADEPT